MKKPFSTIAIGFLLICVGCVRIDSSETHGDLRAKAIVTQTNPIPNDIKELEVDNSFGPVGIVGVEDGSTECVWTLTAHAETDALAQEAASAESRFNTLTPTPSTLTRSLRSSGELIGLKPIRSRRDDRGRSRSFRSLLSSPPGLFKSKRDQRWSDNSGSRMLPEPARWKRALRS